MENDETTPGASVSVGGDDGRGYDKPPWRFKGRAVYQVHLVKSEIARALIPKDFTLVHAFGYTLGGFFLANYDHSPVGVFDELVVIPGIVWNPPTSCAWASKVFVNSTEACLHGRKYVGLPSSLARFSKFSYSHEQKVNRGPYGIMNMIGLHSRFHLGTNVTSEDDIFSINLMSAVPKEDSKAWLGPLINMSLPSFSGRTEDNPYLLKYTCQMKCRVRVVQPLQIFKASPATVSMTERQGSEDQSCNSVHQAVTEPTDARSHLSLSVMLSKPILALQFSCLNMNVEAPLVISQ